VLAGNGRILVEFCRIVADGQIRRTFTDSFTDSAKAKMPVRSAKHSTGKAWLCKSIGYLGIAYFYLSDIRKAFEFYEQALAISHKIKYRQAGVQG
jgi:tetratricopeptide (TPR) repeat protein